MYRLSLLKARCLWPRMLISSIIINIGVQIVYIESNNAYYIEQCMTKIIEEVQPCSERAIQNWNLNHSYFVPSKLSTCCANWQVYECFIQAALVSCLVLPIRFIYNPHDVPRETDWMYIV